MRFFLDRHGCAKNQVDAEILYGVMSSYGWSAAETPDQADLIIVNSCGFIEDAKKESINAVVSARAAYPEAKILLAGCLAERYGGILAESLPEADGFFGNGDLSRLGEMLRGLFPGSSDSDNSGDDGGGDNGDVPSPGGKMPPEADDPGEGRPIRSDSAKPILIPPQTGVCSGARPELFSFPGSAYVKLTEGCSNWCSFCAIPIIRGSLRSRSVDEIVSECASLVSRGVFELNFIGQDLAVFGMDSCPPSGSPSVSPSPLSTLLKKVSSLPGDFRVRLLYMHPDHFPQDVLPVMAADARFLPYFDLPFQSGDADVLRGMNRRGDAGKYLSLMHSIREAFSSPDNPYGTAVFRTTFLTGFPGETEAAFERTLSFLREGRFLWSGAFTFSPEEGTAAYWMKPRVPKKTARARRKALYDAQEEITADELRRFVGKRFSVLVEECIPPETDDQETLLAIGRTWFQAPEVDGSVVLRYRRNAADRAGNRVAPGSVVDAEVSAVRGADVEAFALEA